MNYDVIVIGGGHAGVEAGVASAKIGAKTLLVTMSIDVVANMPCNPSVGGSGKGHLVREIDALGGVMGSLADASFIQSRVLGRGKGYAVHSLRVQADKNLYKTNAKKILEHTENLEILQSEIISVHKDKLWVLETNFGEILYAKAVIFATGTFLSSRVIVGDKTTDSGPDNMRNASKLSSSIEELGLETLRLKTGTPPRIKASSVDFTKLQEQHGDEEILPFSFETTGELENRAICHICYTNTHTHEIIKKNIKKSAMYSGLIEGIGPRYCPSIEDKIMRFADKDRHQLFLEPLGLDTEELYLGGLSTSFPPEIQEKIVHSIEGLENAIITRPAYAIEYDAVNPLELTHTLEYKKHKGLFGAGQINGSSGYEEAGCQGLVAGINAACYALGEEQLALERSGSYIGVLIDDLVTKGTKEPYRMMTARVEHRMLLRQDNADERLTTIGYKYGLISEDRYVRFVKKQKAIKNEIERLRKSNKYDLLKRPENKYDDVGDVTLPKEIKDSVEIRIKYSGYIDRELKKIKSIEKAKNLKLPQDIDYTKIDGIKMEARIKLNEHKPKTIAEAKNISGITPSDIAVLLLLSKKHLLK